MPDRPEGLRLTFEDDFDATELDREVWLPHYLPAWSSRAETLATYAIGDSCLHLTIAPSQGLWCGDDHKPPIRASGIQSGNFSGPVGSTIGQQPYRDGLAVREKQEAFWGWTPQQGYIEMRARGVVTRTAPTQTPFLRSSWIAFGSTSADSRPTFDLRGRVRVQLTALLE